MFTTMGRMSVAGFMAGGERLPLSSTACFVILDGRLIVTNYFAIIATQLRRMVGVRTKSFFSRQPRYPSSNAFAKAMSKTGEIVLVVSVAAETNEDRTINLSFTLSLKELPDDPDSLRD